MKIGYIHDSRMPAPEANTVNVAKMCDAFAANGHEVTLVHLPTQMKGVDVRAYYGLHHPIRTIALPRGGFPGGGRVFAAMAAAIFRMRGVELVYGRKAELLLPSLRLGMPVVVETHEEIHEGRKNSRAALTKMLGSPKLRRMVVISEALREAIAAEWPRIADRLLVAHDGADAMERPLPVPDAGRARPLIGYAGHLYPGKGMELIHQLALRRPDIDFLVLGGKGDDLVRWRAETANMPNITLTGMVPHSEVPERLAACDLVLAPYANEVRTTDGRSDIARWMSPLKIFEYMAQGLPMMASDLPVLREVLEDGVDAALCPPGDADAWLARMDALLADPAARAAMGAAARAKLEARFTWRIRARDVIAGL